jgi:hypothetical protein
LCQNVPPSPSSKYAEEGTTAHDYAARVLENKTSIEELAFKDNVSSEMLDAIQLYVDTVRALPGELRVETKVELDQEAWGTADAIVVQDNELHVLDLKYGAGKVVEAENNPQLIFYGLAALHQHPTKTKVTVWIVQPRAQHSAGPVRKMELTVPDFKHWKSKFSRAIKATHAPDAKLCKGDHCRWCPALITCPEQGKLTVIDEAQDLRRSVVLPEVTQLTPVQITRVLQNLPTLETWASALRAHAMKLASEGVEIPEFKVVAGRSYRSWADPTAALKFLREKTDEDSCWQPREIISPAVAEKEHKLKLPAELIAKSIPKPALVPVTDKRPEFKIDPSKMFETINEVNDNE